MKSAILWVDPAEGTVTFYTVTGDWRRFQNVIVNITPDAALTDDLVAAWYDGDGAIFEPVTQGEWQRAIVDGAYLVYCGFCS